ncbi:MAG: hypothetical protein PHW32_01985 [Bacilli bacterium]|nr:hypothetical protein [Bacilli bacterium]MDD4282235.1 hypothetical protein [Bacilli bacterium]MDD4718615.1 hypothetical protein [Bacilli bacterium]
MYNERNEEFSIRDIVLQLLFVVLFVFILLWLFPTKSDITKLANKNNNNLSLDPILVRIYNDNLLNMKDAGKDYFTTERVPSKIGEKVTITLGQMLEKKLLLPFVDSDGRQCDLTKSYIEVTKVSEVEYSMKINLDCTDATDYILVPMGCYDFCKTDICEKEVVKPVTNPGGKTKVPVKPIPNKPKPKPEKPKPKPEKPTPEKPKVEYLYEYSKTTDASYTSWSGWSSWKTTFIRDTNLVDVKTRTVENKVKKQIATRKITEEVPYMATEKVHINNRVVISNKCTKTGTVTQSTGQFVFGEWTEKGIEQFKTPPKDTSTTRYVRVANSSGDALDCTTNCQSVYSNYKVFTRKSYLVKQGVTMCLAYEDIKVIAEYDDHLVTKYRTEVRYEPIYGYVYEKDTEYRSRTRKLISGSTSTKWSVHNDTKLLNNGYTYTGNIKEK